MAADLTGNIRLVEGQEPPNYVSYPRPHLQADVRKLELLRDAYYGAYWLIASTVVVGVVSEIVAATIAISVGIPDAVGGYVVMGAAVPMVVVNFLIAHRCAARVGLAMGWGSGYAVSTALVACLVSPCCIGVLGTALVQHVAFYELQRHGVPKRFFGGLRKADIEQQIGRLKEAHDEPSQMSL